MVLDEVDSTNAEALRQAHAGEVGPLWIRAQLQTMGRGRQGREWVSQEGNLYCSLLLRLDLSQGSTTGLSFVAALAVFDAAQACLADCDAAHGLSLKWPNDLLVNGAKLSGILLEATSAGAAGTGSVAIGVGVNVASSPDVAGYLTTDLSSCGSDATVDTVFAQLAGAFDSWLRIWRGGDGFGAIRSAWLERAGGLGQEVVVRLPNEQLTGTFVGLDDNGALVLRDASGNERNIFAGDLFLTHPPLSVGADV